MNSRHLFEQVQVTGYLGTRDAQAPDRCVACPRKLGLIANDRCLEYQEADHCVCPNAAIRSVLGEVRTEEIVTRRRTLRRKAHERARRKAEQPC